MENLTEVYQMDSDVTKSRTNENEQETRKPYHAPRIQSLGAIQAVLLGVGGAGGDGGAGPNDQQVS